MTKYATEELNYYFYEEAEDKEGFFTVYFGNNDSQFMASFIAEFQSEDDANEYVEWKNLQLELEEGNLLDDGPELDHIDDDEELEDGVEDLVETFARQSREALD